MSIELEDAKTKVAEFQKQCEEYLVVIVQQKRDADEQQKVSNIFFQYIPCMTGRFSSLDVDALYLSEMDLETVI